MTKTQDDLFQIIQHASSKLTKRQMYLSEHGKHRVKKKWRNKYIRLLNKSAKLTVYGRFNK